MNEFKSAMKFDTEKVREIDDKISGEIAKFLYEMMQRTQNENERKQILNRMLGINNIFNNFDRNIELIMLENSKNVRRSQDLENEINI